MLDAELLERAPDLGETRLVDLARGGGEEVVAAAVGVERAEQALGRDRLGQAQEARLRALLFDQDRRVDGAGRIVQRDHEIELTVEARQPGEGRGVLEQQHPRQRPARPLLAMGAATRGRLDQPRRVQRQLGHRVAEAVVVPLHQLLVEVLDRVVGVALAVEPTELGLGRLGHPPRRGAPDPAVEQPRLALLEPTPVPAPEIALAHPQNLRRLGLAQRALLPALRQRLELHHPHPLQHLRPVHPRPLLSWSDSKTGQLTCYKIRTDDEPATPRARHLARPARGVVYSPQGEGQSLRLVEFA